MVFGILAYAFRTRPGEKPVPIMLALAAVTFSTMHQSSLGSLFLLMPDKLNHLWWSPMMPVFFLPILDCGRNGTDGVIEMWIARPGIARCGSLSLRQMGQIAFWAMLVYQVARLTDLIQRGGFQTGGSKIRLLSSRDSAGRTAAAASALDQQVAQQPACARNRKHAGGCRNHSQPLERGSFRNDAARSHAGDDPGALLPQHLRMGCFRWLCGCGNLLLWARRAVSAGASRGRAPL